MGCIRIREPLLRVRSTLTAGQPMKIGIYARGEELVSDRSVTEMSAAEYVLPRMYHEETILQAPNVVYLGRPWTLLMGTIQNRIYKVLAQFTGTENDAHIAYVETYRSCVKQFGTTNGTVGGSGAKWKTPFGNILLDQHSVSFRCTHGAAVRSSTPTPRAADALK